MFAEFGVGIGFGSLALLADAFHMLSDLLSLVIGGAAIHVCVREVCVWCVRVVTRGCYVCHDLQKK